MTGRPDSPYLDWNSVETMQFDWGYIKWITAGDEEAPEFPTTGIVVLLPGKGHDRHHHPESHELLYVARRTRCGRRPASAVSRPASSRR